jgi:hypothetical protein
MSVPFSVLALAAEDDCGAQVFSANCEAAMLGTKTLG